MNTADDAYFLATLLKDALELGILHVGTGIKRKSPERLINLLRGRHGDFRHRNFHKESLNRAYGIPFTCDAKRRQVAAIEAERAADEKVWHANSTHGEQP